LLVYFFFPRNPFAGNCAQNFYLGFCRRPFLLLSLCPLQIPGSPPPGCAAPSGLRALNNTINPPPCVPCSPVVAAHVFFLGVGVGKVLLLWDEALPCDFFFFFFSRSSFVRGADSPAFRLPRGFLDVTPLFSFFPRPLPFPPRSAMFSRWFSFCTAPVRDLFPLSPLCPGRASTFFFFLPPSFLPPGNLVMYPFFPAPPFGSFVGYH